LVCLVAAVVRVVWVVVLEGVVVLEVPVDA
jgi:hypothetical protein